VLIENARKGAPALLVTAFSFLFFRRALGAAKGSCATSKARKGNQKSEQQDYQMVTDQIIRQLREVDPRDYSKPWFCCRATSPINLRGHGLSANGNQSCAVVHSGFNSKYFLGTFKQWKKQTRCTVRKARNAESFVCCGNSLMRQTTSANATDPKTKRKSWTALFSGVFNSQQR